MKKLIPVFILLISLNISAQKYKYHAMLASGMTIKVEGTIEITDSLLIITYNDKGNITTNDYDIINSRNNITYVSDGVSTHYFHIGTEKGKKKKKRYNGILYFTMKVDPNSTLLLYYLTEED